MQINVIREKRKTIVLKVVDTENAVLKVPKFLNDQKIKEFLNSKKNWLEKTTEKIKSNDFFAQKFDLKNNLYLNGEFFQPVEALKSKAKNKILNFYKSKFFLLEKVAQNISEKTGLKFNEVKILSSKRVWGSFNAQGVMKLNFKLVILPARLLEYVILHELCHAKQMNHSAKFWALVQKYLPNFKELKIELNQYSFLLKEQF